MIRINVQGAATTMGEVPDNEFPWLTLAEAASVLAQRGIVVYNAITRVWHPPSVDLVRKWCARGALPARRVGNRYLVYRPALETFTPPRTGRPYQPDAAPESQRRRGKRRRIPPPPGADE